MLEEIKREERIEQGVKNPEKFLSELNQVRDTYYTEQARLSRNIMSNPPSVSQKKDALKGKPCKEGCQIF